MKMIRVLVYEGDAHTVLEHLEKRELKECKVMPKITITEAFVGFDGIGFGKIMNKIAEELK